MARFSGKVAFITGAASGIGRAICTQLIGEGATVVGADVDEAGLKSLTDEHADRPFVPQILDVSSRSACVEAIEQAVAAYGHLDVLGNVAGITLARHATDYTEAEYRRLMGICADGPFFLAQAALPHLVASSGSLINIASNSGVQGVPYIVPYSMAKGAIVAMTKSLAIEYVKTGVRINAIAPGGTMTGIARNYQLPPDVDPDLARRAAGHRGINSPEEVAAMFCFVASDEAPGIHGAILTIDRGLTV